AAHHGRAWRGRSCLDARAGAPYHAPGQRAPWREPACRGTPRVEDGPMLTPEENELLTRVGPGTPAGEVFRRYWWPVGLSELLGTAPVPVRILGEDLVLFRTRKGEPGLLGRHCTHRLASLEFGRTEEQGIRCCYHGWLYDVHGRCLEQPAEPPESTFKDRIRQKAYMAQEAGGL